MGRLQGDYPIYLPSEGVFTQKLVHNAHYQTLHGGVGLTMTKVREEYWIPRLRQITKRAIKSCYGCIRYRAMALAAPRVAPLPLDRTVGTRPFEVIGMDFAGPIEYQKTASATGKAHILLIACSLSRALCLELMPDQSLETFFPTLKKFFAQRGRPRLIYSDNFSTFVASSKWLKKAARMSTVNDYLASNQITWKFNMSRAPWWGGQFERMVGLVKQALYKVISNKRLSWSELADVLTDVELTLNNRPLSYVEDGIQMPILTPNIMMFGQPNAEIDDETLENNDDDLRKRARYLQECKQTIWARWSTEYVRALRERHNMKNDSKAVAIKPGDVMMLKGEHRNRGSWKVGVVEDLITGKDNVVRGVKLRVGKTVLERAIQHLYPLEISCDVVPNQADAAEARATGPKRNAAVVADVLVRDQLHAEEEDPVTEW